MPLTEKGPMAIVYVTDEGPKVLSEMTRSELIDALNETGRALIAARQQAARDMEMLFPARGPRWMGGI